MDSTKYCQEEQFEFSQQEEPQYAFYLNPLSEDVPEDSNDENQERIREIIYSPNQPFLFRKAQDPPALESLDNCEPYTLRKLSCDNQLAKRKHSFQFERLPEKKVCLSKIEEHSTTISEHEQQDIQCQINDEHDLEQLVNVIKLESKRVKHIQSETLPYKPTHDQEKFLLTYMNEGSISRMKCSIDEDIADGTETKQFLQWLNNLCSQTNYKQMKEIGRKQKVQKYLEKKYSRTYEKKVHYHIRQKVAEERLRVKGRFVTWGQALEMLHEGSENKRCWNSVEYLKVKQMLHDKFSAGKSVKSLKNI